jgi:hypothetical protein
VVKLEEALGANAPILGVYDSMTNGLMCMLGASGGRFATNPGACPSGIEEN